ncbi:hypothetical protein GW756_04305 [bacterium]|nr:hypothetical protein [bacterium]NCQ55178.1 hypothetical protein [Candidatus Parcubacteria bacterium]NCS67309.1 hypothetical protein [Candidatus Peregrinibacteria bacterium]NCS96564.1 hypothetical protein [bacterium]
MEGFLPKCLGAACPVSCCSTGVAETVQDFKSSVRARFQTTFEELGIVFTNEGGVQIRQTNCGSAEGQCKILEFSPDIDIRPLACKIFPYKLYTDPQNRNRVWISLSSCPATQPGLKAEEAFSVEVIRLIKDYYKQQFDREVEVKIFTGVQQA